MPSRSPTVGRVTAERARARIRSAGDAAVLAAVAATALALPATPLLAQGWPAKPVRLVVPVAPGGGTDILGRTVAARLTESLGQQVVVENRGGAGGNIGTDHVAKSAPDGYSLVIVNTSYGINPGLYRNMPFDAQRDLAPVTRLTRSPLLLVAHPSLPVRSVKQLVALARSRPGEINYASSGNGQSNHLAGELFNTMAKVKLVHVPYKGGGAVLTDLIGGHVTLFFGGIISTLPHAKSGKLHAIAVTSLQRAAALPDVPTVAEAALPGFEAVGWYGILVPAATPRDIVTRLDAELQRILRTPDMQERIVKDGSEPAGSGPGEFAEFIRAEIAKWSRVIRESGARID